MSPNSPGDVPPAGPPKGLLAAVAAGKLASETVADVPVGIVDANGNHQQSSVDPNYDEPSPPEDYRKVLEMYDVARDASGDPHRTIASLMRLVEKCIGRIEVLETALRPFANQSVQLANATMCLQANGRDEPAGGLWVSGVQSIHCVPAESLFYNAADTYGRKRVEQNMERAFERLRKAQEAQVDQSVHIEGGGKLQ